MQYKNITTIQKIKMWGTRFLVFALLFSLVFAQNNGLFTTKVANAANGVPKIINFQGKITKTSDGTNVTNGNYDVVFKIYSASSGGSALWTETWNSGTSQVTLTNGVFTAKLGTYSDLSTVDFTTDTLYLGVNFNSDGEMTPRKQLTAAPYALNSNNLVGDGRIGITYTGTSTPAANITFSPSTSTTSPAVNITAGSNVTGAGLQVTQNGSGYAAILTGGNVGIGSTTASSTLFIQGSGSTNPFKIASSTGSSMMAVEPTGLLGIGNGYTSDSNFKVAIKASTSGIRIDGATSYAFWASNGSVVASSFNVTGTEWNKLYRTSTSFQIQSPDDISFSTGSNSTPVVLGVFKSSGNFGIGTTSPTATLFVQGTSTAATTNPFVIASSSGASLFTFTPTGNLGIGTSTPGRTLTVVGDIRATGGFYDSNNSGGSNGYVLQTTGSATQWVATSTLGFASAGSFSGTNGYVARWTSSSALGSGTVLDNGTVAGVNATSSSYTFNIQGAAGLSPLNVASSSGSSMFMVTAGGNIGIGTTTPNSSIVVNKSDTAPVFYFTGKSNDGTTDTGGGIAMYLTHNGVGNRQFAIVDTDTGNGLRYIGSSIDGYNVNSSSRLDLTLGTATNGAHVSSALTNTQFSISNIGGTVSKIVTAIAGAAGQTGDFLQVRTSAATTGDLFAINSYGNVGINTSSPIATLAITASSTTNPLVVTSGSYAPYLIVTNGGNVGIGTSTPIAQLALQSSSSTTNFLDLASTSGVTMFRVDNAGAVSIRPNASFGVTLNGDASSDTLVVNGRTNSARARIMAASIEIQSGGSGTFNSTALALYNTQPIVWAGTSNATAAKDLGLYRNAANVLEVNTGSAGTWADLITRNYSANTTSTSTVLTVQGLAGKDIVDISSSTGTSLFHITQAGNVGIGTASPGNKLDVNGNSIFRSYAQYNDVATLSGYVGNGNGLISGAASASLGVRSAGMLYFSSNNSATASMVLDTNGNVGIGTTTPGRTLSVVGDIRATGILYDSTNAAGSNGNFLMSTATGYAWTSTSTLFGSSLHTGSGTNGYVARWTGTASQGNGVLLDDGTVAGVNATSSTYSFNIKGASGVAPLNVASSSGTSLLTVLGNGNVGIGSASPIAKLDISGATNFVANLWNTAGGVNRLYFSNNDLTYIEGGQNSSVTGTAIQLRSGADGDIMTLLNNGKVGIGTTAPLSLLDVAGTAQLHGSGTSVGLVVSSTGNVGIGTTNPSTFNLQAAGTVGPQTNNTYDFGSSSLQWKDGYFAGNLTVGNSITRSLTRGISATVNDVVDIGTFAFSNGGGSLWVSITVPSSGYSVAKQYVIPIQYAQNANIWQTVLPENSTGAYSGHDFALEIKISSNQATLRIRTLASAGNAGTAYVTIRQEGVAADTFTASTATTSTSTLASIFSSTVLTQTAGNVGINTSTPGRTLSVVGDIRATGILYDSSNTAGSNGNFLMSTATGYAWTSTSTLFGSSLHTGSGTNGYVTRWTGTTALGNGVILDNGTVAGINATSTSYSFNVQGGSGVSPFNVSSSTGVSMFGITQAGNVGIGTTTPSATLHIITSAAGSKGLIVQATTSQTANLMEFQNSSGQTIGTISNDGKSWNLSGNTNDGITLTLRNLVTTDSGGFTTVTNNGGGGYLIKQVNSYIGFNTGVSGTNERLRIDNVGNIGVGTSSPVASLQVTGAAINEAGTSSNITRGLYISPNPTNAANTLQGFDYRGFETAGYTYVIASTTGISNVYGTLHNQITVNTTTVATLANASNVYINGAPKSTSNLTITSSTALTIFGGTVSTTTNAYGLWLQAPTGASNNYAAIFNGGNVGVGTSVPLSLFDVAGTAQLRGSASTVGLVVTSGGNVGIGTANPGNARTQIYGGSGAAATTDAGNTLRLCSTTTACLGIGFDPSAPFGTWFESNGGYPILLNPLSGNVGVGTTNPVGLFDVNTKFTVLSGGNVGVGTTTPGSLLQLNQGTLQITGTSQVAPSSGVGMELFYNGSSSYQFSYDRGNSVYKPYELRASTINLNGNNANGGVGLYVNSSNQVGINTTTPQATFDVQGTQVVGNPSTVSGQITVYGQGSRGSFRAVSATGNKGYNLASSNYEFKIEQPGDVNYIRIRKDDSQTSELMRIQGDGNVGIGISAPVYILDVSATSGSASDLFRVASATGTTGLVVKNNGNVGIGNTGPLYKFDVSGGLRVATSSEQSTTSRGIAFNPGGLTYNDTITNYNTGGNLDIGSVNTGNGTRTVSMVLFNNQTTDNSYIAFNTSAASTTAGTERLRIDKNGNVGIGTTSPATALAVVGVAKTLLSTSNPSGISLNASTSPFIGFHASDNSQRFNISTIFNGSTSLDVLSVNATAVGNILNVTGAGNVGIGTTTPSKTLQVYSSSGTAIKLTDSSINSQGFEIYPTTGAAAHGFSIYDASAGATRFTINSNGNVGIGTTTPLAALQVGATAGDYAQISTNSDNGLIIGYGGSTRAQISANAYGTFGSNYTTGNGEAGIKLGFSSYAYITSGNGNLLLQPVAGNVGVGTTTPGNNLSVVGVINATTGFRVSNAATSGNYLRGDGTNFISSAIQAADVPTLNQNTTGSAYYVTSRDTRATNDLPQDYGQLVKFDFKQNSTNSFPDGGTYNGVMTWRSYGTSTDLSGGPVLQLGYGTYGNMYSRISTGTGTWASWLQILNGNTGVQLQTSTPGTQQTGNLNISGAGLFGGNVGIGTTTPIYKLDVRGTAQVTGTLTAKTIDATYTGGSTYNELALRSSVWPIAASSVSTRLQVFRSSGADNQLDKIQLYNGDTGYVTINPYGGNVGIGTTSPTATLFVQGSSTLPSANLLSVASSTGTQYLTVSNIGNVGIGTTTPGRTLSVVGDIRATGILYDSTNSAGTNGMVLQTSGSAYTWVATSTLGITASLSGGTNGYVARWTSGSALSTGVVLDNGTVAGISATSSTIAFNIQGTSSLDPLQVGTSTNTSMFIVKGNTGNVGIGSATPGAKLNIVGNDADTLALIRGTNVSLISRTDSSGNGNGYFGTLAAHDLNLVTNNTAKLTILGSNGNVGIGSATPAQKLDVNGNANIMGTNADGGVSTPALNVNGAFMTIGDFVSGQTFTNGLGIKFNDSSVAHASIRFASASSTPRFDICASGSNSYLNCSTGSETLSITVPNGSVGNVGIGSITPTQKLDVVGNAVIGTAATTRINITGVGGTNAISETYNGESTTRWQLGRDLYVSGTAGIALNGSGATYQMIGGDSSGNMLFATNATIGSGSSSERMRINSNGNVGIATTTPQARLSVVGTSAIDPFDIASTSAVSYLRVKANGNVGIGTSTPSYPLVINGQTSIPTTAGGVSIVNPIDGSGLILAGAGNGVQSQLRIVANGGAWADSQTTSYFQVKNATNNNLTFMGGTYGADTQLNRLQFNAINSTFTDLSFGSTPVPNSLLEVINSSTTKIGLKIKAASSQTADIFQAINNSSTVLFNINSAGNVGIGTSTPGRTLSVVGDIRATGILYDSNNSAGTSGMVLQTSGTAYTWVATSTLGISGSLSGGTNGYVARWTSGSALSTGVVLDNGTVAGISATSSTIAFNIQGTSSLDPLQAGTSTNAAMFIVKGNTGNVGVGTSSPNSLFAVSSVNGNSAYFSGNVGIGTANPNYRLHIGGGNVGLEQPTALVFANGQTIKDNGGGGLAINSNTYKLQLIGGTDSTNGLVELQTNNQVRMTVTNGGNVGIGTSTPLARLAVVGASGANDILDIASSSGVSALRLTSNGKLGLGTTNPLGTMEIYTATSGAVSSVLGLVITRDSGSANFGPSPRTLDLGFRDGPNFGMTAGLSAIRDDAGSTWNSHLAFYTSNQNTNNAASVQALNERMRINSNGNVGIGTSTPIAGLQITNSTINDSGSNSNITRGLYISPNPTGAANTLQGFDFRGLETSSYTLVLASTTGISNIYGTLHNQITVNTTTVATLASASNVYINGAPKSTSNLTITSSTALSIFGGAVSTTTNAYGLYLQAPTGATNNYAAVFAGGNVGINTTSPLAKLHVYEGASSATLTQFTQGTANAGILVDTVYSSGNYSPGLFWQTSNQNNTKPKAGIWTYADGNGSKLYFGTSNSYSTGITNNGLVLDQAGNVGIGTVSPASLLQVAGALRLGVSSTTAGTLILHNSSNGYTTTLQSSSTQASSLTFTFPNATGSAGQVLATDGAGGLYWTTAPGGASQWTTAGSDIYYTTGKVLIGTTTTTGTLTVQAAAGVTPFSVSSSSGLSFLNLTSAGNLGIGTTTPLTKLAVVGTAGTNDILDIASSSGLSILRVMYNGNVGIGTSSPVATFAVNGTSYYTATSTFRGTIIGSGATSSVASAIVTGLNADFLDGYDSSAFGDATLANQKLIMGKTSSLLGLPKFAGDGSDGAGPSSGTLTSAVKQYSSWTLTGPITASEAAPTGLFIAVSGTLSLGSSGSISVVGKGRLGGNTSAFTSGQDCTGTAAVYPENCTTGAGGGGGGGSSGGFGDVFNASPSNGGNGGGAATNGGNRGNADSSAGSAPSALAQLDSTARKLSRVNTLLTNTNIYTLATGQTTSNAWVVPLGAGGGYGGYGGSGYSGSISGVGGNAGANSNGGNGGGIIYIEADTISTSSTTPVIKADGAAGANGGNGGNASGCAGDVAGGGGGAGGSGGGGGGFVWIRAKSLSGITSTTVTANGGSGGSGGSGGTGCGGGSSGTAGRAGAAGATGFVLIEQVY